MSYMSFVAGGDLSGGIKYVVGEMSDTCRRRRAALLKEGKPRNFDQMHELQFTSSGVAAL